MSESGKPKISLGIIGGGQLAQMLVQNNPFHDLQIHIYHDQKDCPAQHTGVEISVSKVDNKTELKKFFEKINILTIENEFVNSEILSEMKDSFEKVFFFPSIPAIKATQNKLSQKYLFEKLKLPTAAFISFEPGMDQPTAWIKKAITKFPHGFMLKKAFGGYDGKGNFKVNNANDFLNAEMFIADALKANTTIYAEELVTFKKELAQIYVRGLKQDFISYPLVISEQEKNVCRLVYGPATEFDVSKDIETQTTEIGTKIAQELNFVGTFAIEYFLTADNKVLINEMAPRVHNSGHYTLDATPQNQFENHLRAVLGAPLKAPVTYPFFAMRNILGPIDIEKTLDDKAADVFEKTEDARVHWYFKKKTAPYRKMGHINTIAMTKQDLLKKINFMEKVEENFWQEIR